MLWLVLGGGISLPLDLRSPADLWSAVDTLAGVISLWLPGLGVAVAVPVLVMAPFHYTTGLGLVSLLFTSVMAGIRWPWRRLVVLMALQAAFLLYDFVIVATLSRTLTLAGVLAVSYAVGRWIHRWLVRQHRGEKRIASLARRTAHAREEERTALAKELATLLVRGVGDIARSLDRARSETDLAAKRRILHRVGDDCRTALARLRLLVPTLRARRPTATASTWWPPSNGSRTSSYPTGSRSRPKAPSTATSMPRPSSRASSISRRPR
ncbi:hypothetical protein G7085_08185 [Tessaracoccus sp. HDW20]|uniref:hypothetical protein n=1 Tax=Tessaracoccus coleopterorum TaxID=2714950 RepID=UPI0018D275CD|nr:hypothetical protein [Tessaracoccus coleopterorum]NHB84598.1 hypothetical protein [Tessaracoccus coleopterorum]